MRRAQLASDLQQWSSGCKCGLQCAVPCGLIYLSENTFKALYTAVEVLRLAWLNLSNTTWHYSL